MLAAMCALQTVPVATLPPERFEDVVLAEQRPAIRERRVWNVNSTASGGGVAEMLHSLLAYARGARVDARWLVLEGSPAFFAVTKRVHHRLHGAPGDGGPLGDAERAVYEEVLDRTAAALREVVRPGDIV